MLDSVVRGGGLRCRTSPVRTYGDISEFRLALSAGIPALTCWLCWRSSTLSGVDSGSNLGLGAIFWPFLFVRNCLRTAEDDRNPTVKLQQRLATDCDGIDTMCIMFRALNVLVMKL